MGLAVDKGNSITAIALRQHSYEALIWSRYRVRLRRIREKSAGSTEQYG